MLFPRDICCFSPFIERSVVANESVHKFVYESVHKTSPVCFYNFFRSLESAHQYGTGQSEKDDIFLPLKILINMVLDQFVTMEQNIGTASL